MTLKSYPLKKTIRFSAGASVPVHLGYLRQRSYYAFARNFRPPSGGKTVTAVELAELKISSYLLHDVKAEAQRRILALANDWQQRNALADLYQLTDVDVLSAAQQNQLDAAKFLLSQVQKIRLRSDQLEESLLSGELVDYQTDAAWEQTSHARS